MGFIREFYKFAYSIVFIVCFFIGFSHKDMTYQRILPCFNDVGCETFMCYYNKRVETIFRGQAFLPNGYF